MIRKHAEPNWILVDSLKKTFAKATATTVDVIPSI